MEGKINKDGRLCIKRGSKFVRQYCHSMPTTYNLQRECNDTCVLFGEPETCGDTHRLVICKKTFFFKPFTDERV